MRRNVNGWVLGLGVLLLPGMAAAQQEWEPLPGVTPASAYVGLGSSCAVFSGQWWNAGDVRGTLVREVCGVPQEAVAVHLEVRSESLGGQSPQVKVWAADAPEPTHGVLEETFGKAGQSRQALVLVPLCGDGDCTDGDLLLRSSAQALLEVRVAGYFQPWAAVSGESAEDLTEVSGGSTLTAASGELLLKPMAIEGPTNTFYGQGTGANNSTGEWNSFFGANAGSANTEGSFNSFFGADAGQRNTAGSSNAFFGDLTGTRNTTGNDNAFFGKSAGENNTTGGSNAFFGRSAGLANTEGGLNAFFGREAGFSNTTASNNSFFGAFAGRNNTTGSSNAFFGTSAGQKNTTGNRNAFFGNSAGRENTTGFQNAFFGDWAGFNNTIGRSNAFFGHTAGRFNTEGALNAFFGDGAGRANTTGSSNAFFGISTGSSNTEGSANAFFGGFAGQSNTTGGSNAFVGHSAGVNNTAGGNNAFFGPSAGRNNTEGGDNAFFGRRAGLSNTVESNNTFIGANSNGVADITNATALGHRAQVSQSNSLVLGSIAGENFATESVNVGIGTSAPVAPLHIRREDNTGEFLFLQSENAGPPQDRAMMQLTNNGGIRFQFDNPILNTAWRFQAATGNQDNFEITKVGTGAIELRLDGGGNLSVRGMLTQNSDVNTKHDITPVDAEQVLTQLLTLPIAEWAYRGNPPGVRHLGPMAQDFHRLFGLGADATKVAPGDLAGVALAAIQAQQQQLAAQDAKIAELEQQQGEQLKQLAELATLRAQVAAMERLLAGGLPALAQR